MREFTIFMRNKSVKTNTYCEKTEPNQLVRCSGEDSGRGL
jgi:hypothetical protein